MEKRIAALFSFAMMIALIVMFFVSKSFDQKNFNQSVLKYASAKELEEEKSKLQEQKKENKLYYEKVAGGQGTIVLLFPEIRRDLYNKVLPIMMEHGYQGVFVLSNDYFPEKEEEYITWSQYNMLRDEGWNVCVGCDYAENIPEWYEILKESLDRYDFVQPKTVYFPYYDYSDSMDEQLQQCGFRNVVHQGEYGDSNICRDYREDGVIRYGANYWNYRSLSTDLDEIAEWGGNLVLEVAFTNPQKEMNFNEIKFKKFMDLLDTYTKDGRILVTTFKGAKDCRETAYKNEKEVHAQMEEEQRHFDEKIEKVQKKINKIYNENK